MRCSSIPEENKNRIDGEYEGVVVTDDANQSKCLRPSHHVLRLTFRRSSGKFSDGGQMKSRVTGIMLHSLCNAVHISLWTKSLRASSPMHLSNAFGERTSTKFFAARMDFSRFSSNFPDGYCHGSTATVKTRFGQLSRHIASNQQFWL